MKQSDLSDVASGGQSSEAADVEFVNVSKQYSHGSAAAIREFSLYVPAGEICCLIGPSGCGKTTALKMINRLIEPSSGDIRVGGKSVLGLAPTELRRDIGYVFQQVGLLPHLTVAGNIGLTPRLLGWKKDRIAARVRDLLQLIRLPADVADRYPTQLSGGQQQRVGLARALAADPSLLLMDEPFGALDPITRFQLQREVLRLQDVVGKTIVFVTHDIDEAVLMGNKVVVLRDGGEVVQAGTPDEVLGSPVDEYVENFVGLDRGLKRLTLRRLRDLELSPAPVDDVVFPTADADTSLRDALAILFDSGARCLKVCEAERVLGIIDLDGLHGAVERGGIQPPATRAGA